MNAVQAQDTRDVPNDTGDETRRPSRARQRRLDLAEASALPILMVGLIVLFTVLPATSESFPTVENLRITLGSQSVLIVLAMATLFPLMCAEYDLSIGAVAGLGSVFAAAAMSAGHSVLYALAVATAIGVLVGLINGVLVSVVKVNSIVATLGTATLIAGAVSWKTDRKSIIEGIPSSLSDFTSGLLLGLPRIFYIALIVTVAVYYLLRHTPFGRYLDAIGVNVSAARLLGVKVERRVMASFVLAGALSGAAGLLLVAQQAGASPAVGPAFTLPALAAAFLSVAAIKPGRFNVWGTLVAILFLAVVNSGLILMGAENYVNDFANGGALILGVSLASVLGRRRLTAR